MIKIENVDVYGWEAAIRGMRNPMNSWDKSDSDTNVGRNDLSLMMKLSKAGSDHAKFRRMIMVSMDIVAPLYWWKEFDTYKVGTVANSCSTMHKIHSKPFTLDDFSHEHLTMKSESLLADIVVTLNAYRSEFIRENADISIDADSAKRMWWQMIQLLPSSYNQRRTVLMNYEVLSNMYKARKNHKLDEWRTLCAAIEMLPHSEIITGEGGADDERKQANRAQRRAQVKPPKYLRGTNEEKLRKIMQNGITPEMLDNEYKRGVDDGIKMTFRCIYAAILLASKSVYDADRDHALRLLREVNNLVCTSISDADAMQEVWNAYDVTIAFDEGVDRIKEKG